MSAAQHPFVMNRRFVVRTPLLPQQAFTRWCDIDDGDIESRMRRLRARLAAWLDDPAVREAMVVASPSLAESIPLWREDPDSERGSKAERALVRYLSRMSTRATPFGLFSGVSVGRLGDSTVLQLAPRRDYRRSTRLDGQFIDELSEALARDEGVAAALRFVPNDSLYESAGRLRYVAASTAGGHRTHTLVDVDAHEAVHVVLAAARSGAATRTLIEALRESDATLDEDEAAGFVRELCEVGILRPVLAPPITGDEPGAVLLRRLDIGTPESDARTLLRDALTDLAAIDRDGVGIDPTRYDAIAAGLSAAPATIVPGRLFQVDLFKPAEITICPRVRATLEEGIAMLHRISPSPQPPGLERFREAFKARFDRREVPLAVALDHDVGVGFEPSNDPAVFAEPLLAGLAFPRPSGGGATWSARHDWLSRRLERLPRGQMRLELDDDDIAALTPREAIAPLPDAFAALAVIEGRDADAIARGAFTLHLQGVVGPSGARLLGRFCHLDPELRACVDEHVAAEQRLRPEAVFAEVVHTSEGRVGNVVARPVLRQYEIEFLGNSGAPPERRLAIDDLLVSVQGDRVVLRSRRLACEVVPRLSTAHAYAGPNLPTYRFLCALQDQGIARAGWSWGPLDALGFLPRVCWRNLAFSRARWRLHKESLAPLVAAAHGAGRGAVAAAARRATVMSAAASLRERACLPRYIELADGDHILAVDLDNPASVESFAHLLRGRAAVIVRELVPEPEHVAVRGPEGAFTHELCVPFTRAGEPTRTTAQRPRPRAVAPRVLVPGSEWLYAKIYVGHAHADRVLESVVAPLTTKLRATAEVDRWFFLRYADPEPHLRVRWRGDPERLLTHGIVGLRHALAEWIADGSVARVQLDTYEPELERYGGAAGLAASERFFAADSDAALEILAALEADGGDAARALRWQACVCSIDMLLDDLGLALPEKLELTRAARDAFHREFGVETGFRRQLSAAYRSRHARVEALLVNRDGLDDALAIACAALRRRTVVVRPALATLTRLAASEQLGVPLHDLVRTWVHLICNRLLRSAHRAQEVVLYDLLARAYESLLARARVQTAAPRHAGGLA